MFLLVSVDRRKDSPECHSMVLVYSETLDMKESKTPVSAFVKPKVRQLALLCLMNFHHHPDDKMWRGGNKLQIL